MNKKDKAAFRKIKESGNYRMFLKLRNIKPCLFENQSLYKMYIAIRKPEYFMLDKENIGFEEFLKKNGIIFCF